MKCNLIFLTVVFCVCSLTLKAQWSLTGNSGTTPGTNYIGTSDGQALLIKTNGVERIRIDASGNITIPGNLTVGSITSPGAGIGSERYGAGATTSGNENLAIGYLSYAGPNSIAIGSSTSATGFASTMIGVGANDGGANYLTAIGFNISSPGYFSGGSYLGGGMVNIGYNNNSAYPYTYLIGANLTANSSNQMLIGHGNAGGFLLDVVLGGGIANELAASYGPLKIRTTDGSGANSGGMPLVFGGGKSTGNANGGSIAFYTTAAGTSGSSLNTAAERMTISSNGNVGIGTNNPTEKLEVTDNIRVNNILIGSTTGSWTNTIMGGAVGVPPNTVGYNTFMGFGAGNSSIAAAASTFIGANAGHAKTGAFESTALGYAALQSETSGGYNTAIGTGSGSAITGALYNSFIGHNSGVNISTGSGNTFLGYTTGSGISTGNYNTIIGANVTGLAAGLSNTIILADGEGHQRVFINSSGNAGIGTTTPNTNAKLDVNGNIFSSGKIAIGTTDILKIGSYSLAVNGDAIFNKARVQLYTVWPDYVFEQKYNLLPIAQLEQYIKTNKHLPNIPAAAEVTKNGIDLGDNQVLLLQKIEELTLYIIDQNKSIELLKKDNVKIKAQLDQFISNK